MTGKIVLIILFMICANSGIAGAEYLLIDQSYMMPNVDGWYNLSVYEFHQEFRPSVFSLINAVEVKLYTHEGAKLQVNICDGSCNDKVLGSAKLYLPANPEDVARFIFTPPVPLDRGGSYIIDLKLLEGAAFVALNFEEGGYPEGRMFICTEDGGCEYTPTDLSDIIFQTGIVQSHLIDISKRRRYVVSQR